MIVDILRKGGRGSIRRNVTCLRAIEILVHDKWVTAPNCRENRSVLYYINNLQFISTTQQHSRVYDFFLLYFQIDPDFIYFLFFFSVSVLGPGHWFWETRAGYTYVYVYIRMCIYTHTHTHAHSDTNTHAHTRTQAVRFYYVIIPIIIIIMHIYMYVLYWYIIRLLFSCT